MIAGSAGRKVAGIAAAVMPEMVVATHDQLPHVQPAQKKFAQEGAGRYADRLFGHWIKNNDVEGRIGKQRCLFFVRREPAVGRNLLQYFFGAWFISNQYRFESISGGAPRGFFNENPVACMQAVEITHGDDRTLACLRKIGEGGDELNGHRKTVVPVQKMFTACRPK